MSKILHYKTIALKTLVLNGYCDELRSNNPLKQTCRHILKKIFEPDMIYFTIQKCDVFEDNILS